MTSKLTLKAAAASLAVAALAIAALPAQKAEARHRGLIALSVGLPLVGYGAYYGYHTYAPYRGCGWLHRRAVITDSPYWWSRYHACRGY